MTIGTARERCRSDNGGNRGGTGCRVYGGRGISPEEEVALYMIKMLVVGKADSVSVGKTQGLSLKSQEDGA